MPVRAAVVGMGRMGRLHARLYQELAGVELVGVVDNDPAIAAAMADEHGCPAFGGVRELLAAASPDAVSVTTPPGAHLDVAAEVLGAGVAALVEKPMTTTVAGAQALVALARSRGVALAVCHTERFNPALRALAAELAAGRAGEVLEVRACRVGPPGGRQAIGAALDLAVHDFDLLAHLFPGRAVLRMAAEVSLDGDGADVAVNGLLRLDGDLVAVLDVNWVTAVPSRTLTVRGRAATLVCDLLARTVTRWPVDGAQGPAVAAETVAVEPGNPVGDLVADFVHAVVTGRPPRVTGEDGLRTIELAHDLLTAAHHEAALAAVASAAAGTG